MNAWQITKKDVRLLLRDRRTLLILIALPLSFITILGASTGILFSKEAKSRIIRVAVVNEDASELSGKLMTEVYRLKALQIEEMDSRSAAQQALADGGADILVFIGPDYHTRVEQLDLGDIFYSEEGRLAGHLAALDIHVEAGAFLANAAQIVRELVFAFAVRTIAPDVLKSRNERLALQLLREARKARPEGTDEELPTDQPAAAPEAPSRGNIVYQTLVPSYTVMFVFFLVNFMARSFIAERDLGTLNRLRLAPITRTGVLLGKTFPFLLISLIQTSLLFLAGKVLFGMTWGTRPEYILLIIVCTSLSATALGLLTATVVRTDSQVSAYANYLVLVMAGISGCFMPRAWQTELMQQVGLVTPHAWALIAYEQLLNRDLPNLAVVWRCCGVLLAFAAGFFTLGWWRFRTANG